MRLLLLEVGLADEHPAVEGEPGADEGPEYLVGRRGEDRVLSLAGAILPADLFYSYVHEWTNFKKGLLELVGEGSGDQASDDDLSRLAVICFLFHTRQIRRDTCFRQIIEKCFQIETFWAIN